MLCLCMHACMKSLLYPSIDRKLYGLSIPTHGSRSWSWSWAWSCWCPRCPGSRPYIIYWIGFNKTVIQQVKNKRSSEHIHSVFSFLFYCNFHSRNKNLSTWVTCPWLLTCSWWRWRGWTTRRHCLNHKLRILLSKQSEGSSENHCLSNKR